jgi:hypothetical protein
VPRVAQHASEAVTYVPVFVDVVFGAQGMEVEMGGKSMVEFMAMWEVDQCDLDNGLEGKRWGRSIVDDPCIREDVDAVDWSLVKME